MVTDASKPISASCSEYLHHIWCHSNHLFSTSTNQNYRTSTQWRNHGDSILAKQKSVSSIDFWWMLLHQYMTVYMTVYNEQSSADSLSGKGVHQWQIWMNNLLSKRKQTGPLLILWAWDVAKDRHWRTIGKSYVWPVPLPDNERLWHILWLHNYVLKHTTYLLKEWRALSIKTAHDPFQ